MTKILVDERVLKKNHIHESFGLSGPRKCLGEIKPPSL